MLLLQSIFRPSSVVLLLAVVAGCGPSNPLGRQTVSGKVTLDGAPLDQGTIAFSPVSTTEGVSSGMVIKDGEYSIPTVRGLPPGKYLVRINSAAANPNAKSPSVGVAPGPGNWMGTERIAPQYNEQSQIVIEVVRA